MAEDFRKRLDVEVGDLHRPDGECVPDFVETHLRQTVLTPILLIATLFKKNAKIEHPIA